MNIRTIIPAPSDLSYLPNGEHAVPLRVVGLALVDGLCVEPLYLDDDKILLGETHDDAGRVLTAEAAARLEERTEAEHREQLHAAGCRNGHMVYGGDKHHHSENRGTCPVCRLPLRLIDCPPGCVGKN